ncbi:MAG TPA: solute-binding protein, partial [Syntrophomonadaceae bacterium]|nr:solute-binding protein [Syntrophomonadaceae bacterium]
MEKVRKLTQWVLVVCLMVALVAVGGCGENKADKDEAENGKTAIEDRSLTVYSGAGLRKPMDEIGQAFEEKTGVKVNFNYAGCAQLLGQMELTQEGDVFVGGSLNDAEIALEKGFIQDYQKAVYHI